MFFLFTYPTPLHHFLDPEKPKCVITGLPAKYKDPKTGFYYATLAAFKIIREKYISNV